jgi:hypothetical protein
VALRATPSIFSPVGVERQRNTDQVQKNVRGFCVFLLIPRLSGPPFLVNSFQTQKGCSYLFPLFRGNCNESHKLQYLLSH